MPPVDLTNGLACCPGSFSALEDQRAEILPVRRPPVLSAGGRCTMRLTRILMFPFFSSQHLGSAPPTRGAFQNAQRTFLENLRRIHVINRPVNLVSILRNKICQKRRSMASRLPQRLRSERENKVRLGRQKSVGQRRV